MTNKPKSQHFVPICYLKEFTDPNTPKGYEPYVWKITKDGKIKKPKAPINICNSKHIYTFGKDDYRLETEYLQRIDNDYANILKNKIKLLKPLSDKEHYKLCVYVASMLLRTIRFKKDIENNLKKAIEICKNNDELIKELILIKKDVHKISILKEIPLIAKIFNNMKIAFVHVKSNDSYFITSDDPLNMFNPSLNFQKLKSPGLLQRDVEVTLPITPKIMLCMTWANMRGYIKIDKDMAEEINRQTRHTCDEYFISHLKKVRIEWLLRYPISLSFVLRWLFYNIKNLCK